MKKKLIIAAFAVIAILCVLFVPIPTGRLKDGGTATYSALTYKVVKWRKITDDGIYKNTRVYFYPKSQKSITELWAEEEINAKKIFRAEIVEISGNTVVCELLEWETEGAAGSRISFAVSGLEDIGAQLGSYVSVTYKGAVRESYPMSVDAISWQICKDMRPLSYKGEWLDKTTAEEYHTNIFNDILITEIYADCFFARTVIPMPYTIKLNGKLGDEWCVGDQITVTYTNTYYDSKAGRVEADFSSVAPSTFTPDPLAAYKPVIYLYPQKDTEVTVKLSLNGVLTCTYPRYNDGWRVTAHSDGTLTDVKGQSYNYLYWEGELNTQYSFSEGFCVKGEDTAEFLENALARLGLNRREANEFIVYWLPLMEQNAYNVISFQSKAYADAAKLNVTPAPNSVIRVFMAWYAADSYVELKAQELQSVERVGFTVVEWGGVQVLP